MPKIALLKNPVLGYAWGSRTAIAELLGKSVPAPEPQAEMWMGTHAKAPSRVQIGDSLCSLADVIGQSPRAILGQAAARRYGGQLPFLFKVLAASKPLSIQAHPDADQARKGFDRENGLGISLNSPRRNYRDPYHKPECLCALTPFEGLSGFRRIPEMLALLTRACPDPMSAALAAFRRRPDSQGLKTFFQALMDFPPDRQAEMVAQGLEKVRGLRTRDPAFTWMLTLAEDYPGDVGFFSPLMLNLIRLEPGEAVFLAAGQLHAYLQGVGIELMANSDNVLRGGLTPKHVDVAELAKVVRFEPLEVKTIPPVTFRPGEKEYPTPAEEFRLSVISVTPQAGYLSPMGRSVEILFCIRGDARIYAVGSGEENHLPKGCSALVPAAVDRYRIEGNATVYKAFVPTESWASRGARPER